MDALIVEDNFIIQMFLETIIEEAGFNIVGAVNNSKDVSGYIAAVPLDLIFLDIGIDGPKDGIELAQEIKDTSKIPVVFITGSSDESTVNKALKTNPLHIIYKPIDEYTLHGELKTIIKNLELRKQQTELHS